MSDIGVSRGLTFVEQAGFDLTDTSLTEILTGTGNTNGAWVEYVASLSADADHVVACLALGGSTQEEVLIDIGIGAASSEVVVCENLPYSGRSLWGVETYPLPIIFPAGSRIAVRAQCDVEVSIGIGLSFYKGGEKSCGFSGARGFGINLGNSSGTAVDPGSTANTKGAWVELVASTTVDINGGIIHTGHNDNLIVNTSTFIMVDISIGTAGNEAAAIIISNHIAHANTNEGVMRSVPFDVFIPAGSRISARLQCSDTDATDRIKSIAFVGLT